VKKSKITTDQGNDVYVANILGAHSLALQGLWKNASEVQIGYLRDRIRQGRVPHQVFRRKKLAGKINQKHSAFRSGKSIQPGRQIIKRIPGWPCDSLEARGGWKFRS